MTMLAVPLPPTPPSEHPSNGVPPDPVLPWREVVYPCAAGVWVVVNMLGLILGTWSLAWQVAIFAVPLTLGIIDLGVRGGWLAVDDEPIAPTTWPCRYCGQASPFADLVECDGAVCREHLTDPTFQEVA